MQDYGKRFLIVIIMAAFIGLLFIGGKNGHVRAEELPSLPEGWVWPSEGIISDRFGTRDGAHKGIDIAAPLGTSVVAASDGTVAKSYYSSTYGNVVFLKHDDKYETVYAHLEKRLVNEGDKVDQGQAVGKMGNTGRSRGVHLHFELHLNEWTVHKENAINPLAVLEERVELAQTGNAGSIEEIEDNAARKRTIHVSINNPESEKQIPAGKKEETSQYYSEEDSVAESSDQQETIAVTLGPNYWKTTKKEKNKTITVDSGDTLFSISQRFDTSVENIKNLNGLKSDLIFPEQSLVVN
ncbi:hypothetical protein CVD28_18150 [Bacillus sp. M6-12]|uniref:peptidoglycan DD-metalloendopeptidase family protein n=1 Tax=Bacillus sp. M6-12 TaxID=2054166 RepID=UPI000C76E767|nr:peptidoglycan DD-metalloendopeptidase family protein [Bacillus sp. M6-12]PLS16388.1 hypothetical protein CVD28_18150 [Bacillus sp. M6-12]